MGLPLSSGVDRFGKERISWFLPEAASATSQLQPLLNVFELRGSSFLGGWSPLQFLVRMSQFLGRMSYVLIFVPN